LPEVGDLVLAFYTCDCDDLRQQYVRASNSNCYLHDIDVVDVEQLRTLVVVLDCRMLVVAGHGFRMLVADLVVRTVVAVHKGPVSELVVVVLDIVLVLVAHT